MSRADQTGELQPRKTGSPSDYRKARNAFRWPLFVAPSVTAETSRSAAEGAAATLDFLAAVIPAIPIPAALLGGLATNAVAYGMSWRAVWKVWWLALRIRRPA